MVLMHDVIISGGDSGLLHFQNSLKQSQGSISVVILDDYVNRVVYSVICMGNITHIAMTPKSSREGSVHGSEMPVLV